MRNKGFIRLIFFSLITFINACSPEPLVVSVMAPIYISSTEFSLVQRSDPREFKNLGNIVAVGNFLFIN